MTLMEILNLMSWSYRTTRIKKYPSTKTMISLSECL